MIVAMVTVTAAFDVDDDNDVGGGGMGGEQHALNLREGGKSRMSCCGAEREGM